MIFTSYMVTPISQEYLEVSWGQREFSDLVQALLVDWLKAALGVVPVKVVSPMGAFQVNKGLWVGAAGLWRDVWSDCRYTEQRGDRTTQGRNEVPRWLRASPADTGLIAFPRFPERCAIGSATEATARFPGRLLHKLFLPPESG